MRQKCSIGNLTMMHYLLRYYLNPTDFNMLIYTTQCLQGDYLEMAIRHLRSHRERCAGTHLLAGQRHLSYHVLGNHRLLWQVEGSSLHCEKKLPALYCLCGAG